MTPDLRPGRVGPKIRPPEQKKTCLFVFSRIFQVCKNLEHSEATFTLLRLSSSSSSSPWSPHSQPMMAFLLWICYLARCYFPALERPSMDSLTSWGMKEGLEVLIWGRSPSSPFILYLWRPGEDQRL